MSARQDEVRPAGIPSAEFVPRHFGRRRHGRPVGPRRRAAPLHAHRGQPGIDNGSGSTMRSPAPVEPAGGERRRQRRHEPLARPSGAKRSSKHDRAQHPATGAGLKLSIVTVPLRDHRFRLNTPREPGQRHSPPLAGAGRAQPRWSGRSLPSHERRRCGTIGRYDAGNRVRGDVAKW